MPPLKDVNQHGLLAGIVEKCIPCHYKVVVITHAANGLDDLGLVILDDLDPF
jgi:hypothetical protein